MVTSPTSAETHLTMQPVPTEEHAAVVARPTLARRVTYVSSDELTTVSSRLPSNVGRSKQVHDLVRALGLLEMDADSNSSEDEAGTGATEEEDERRAHRPPLPRATVVPPMRATRKDIGRFHDLDYVDTLLSPLTLLSPTNSPVSSPTGSSSDSGSDSDSSASTPSPSRCKRHKSSHPAPPRVPPLLKYGLLDDSPPFPALASYVLALTGAALAAVQSLTSNSADVAICWDGGRHHALRERASGFCYINDAVLVCLGLLRSKIPVPLTVTPGKVADDDDDNKPQKTRKPRVMYLDFDVHHGDGVALAFLQPLLSGSKPPQILTLSIHHHAPGFFPSSELSALTPKETDHPHTLSLPLGQGASDRTFARVWDECVEPVRRAWEPDWVVVCCGVDGMAGDGEKTGVWNLSGRALGEAVGRVCGWREEDEGVKGVVLLGGGGYNHPNAARAFASFTAIALGRPPIPDETPIPEEGIADEDWMSYGPSFEMGVPAGNMLDTNTSAYLDEVREAFAVLAERVRITPLTAASPAQVPET